MNGVSLHRSAVLAFFLHVTLFGITLWTARHSNDFIMPSPYVVNLVSPEPAARVREAPRAKNSAPSQPQTERRVSPEPSRSPDKSKEQDISDEINALKAKREIKKRVELREIVSVKVGKGKEKAIPSIEAPRPGKGSRGEEYIARIVEEIRRHWEFPTDLVKDKNVEAIISIRIQKNGSLQVIGMEKSSGNPLFDRFALRAITKASPVTQPPQEMEIGVRFYP